MKEKPIWTTGIMAEAMMTTQIRIWNRMSQFHVVDQEKPQPGRARLFTDKEFISVMRIHTLLSKGYSTKEIRNVLENKTMKIDRKQHPILTFGDMDSFVNQ